MKLSLTAIITPTPPSYFRIMGGTNPDRLGEASAYLGAGTSEGRTPSRLFFLTESAHGHDHPPPLPQECAGRILLSVSTGIFPCDNRQPKNRGNPGTERIRGDAVGKAGKTGTDAGASSQVNIGTGLDSERKQKVFVFEHKSN